MLNTSEMPFLSSEHGRLRRAQRDVTKRDLQAAVKYGTKSRGYTTQKHGDTWRYEFADVVYITDSSSTREITSWAVELPISKVQIPFEMEDKIIEARRRIASNPSMITSNTVIIIDMSSSMRNSDVNGHRSRSAGIHYTVAEDFIANRLYPPEQGMIGGPDANWTDVITLIEMRDTATVVFEYQPISWKLFNKFVELRELSDTRNHGNYLNSFEVAFQKLNNFSNECAMCLFFFSDGRPSDCHMERERYRLKIGQLTKFPGNLFELIRRSSKTYGSRLTYNAYGFSKTHTEFEVMKKTIQIAQSYGVKASFGHGSFDISSLRSMLTSTATSVTETRTLLSRLDLGQGSSHSIDREKTLAEKEIYVPSNQFIPSDWEIYNSGSRGRDEFVWEKAIDSEKYVFVSKTVEYLHPEATGFAIRKRYFGEGAERIVYHMIEVNASSRPVGEPLVAKESLYKHKKQDERYLRKWHNVFVKTQNKARKLAQQFNAKLDGLGVEKSLCPRLKYLSNSVYFGTSHEGKKYFLAEKRLDGKYVKYNDNAGRIDGIVKENKLIHEDIAHLQNNLIKPAFDALEEGDEDEDEDEEEDVEEELDSEIPTISTDDRVIQLQKQILESDIPQAFSHWTNRYTKRELLVCDIQVELNLVDGYPVFMLTDPCIHSSRKKFGRTDHGNSGMHSFFRTHQCNAVCEILGIGNLSKS